jgi:hypothetical protein
MKSIAYYSILLTGAFWDIALCILVKFGRHFRGLYCFIIVALIMEAVRTFETSVKFYESTRRNIPRGCHIYTRLRENLNVTKYFAVSRNKFCRIS